jgi:hypothetical protein
VGLGQQKYRSGDAGPAQLDAFFDQRNSDPRRAGIKRRSRTGHAAMAISVGLCDGTDLSRRSISDKPFDITADSAKVDSCFGWAHNNAPWGDLGSKHSASDACVAD